MKIELWQFKYDFDKEDAKIVIPVLLLALGLAFVPINKAWLWSGAVVYYAFLFFLKPFLASVDDLRLKFHWRCPYCKSRDIVFRGLDDYHGFGMVPYNWYLCNHCGKTLIMLNHGRLVKPGPGQGVREKELAKNAE